MSGWVSYSLLGLYVSIWFVVKPRKRPEMCWSSVGLVSDLVSVRNLYTVHSCIGWEKENPKKLPAVWIKSGHKTKEGRSPRVLSILIPQALICSSFSCFLPISSLLIHALPEHVVSPDRAEKARERTNGRRGGLKEKTEGVKKGKKGQVGGLGGAWWYSLITRPDLYVLWWGTTRASGSRQLRSVPLKREQKDAAVACFLSLSCDSFTPASPFLHRTHPPLLPLFKSSSCLPSRACRFHSS